MSSCIPPPRGVIYILTDKKGDQRGVGVCFDPSVSGGCSLEDSQEKHAERAMQDDFIQRHSSPILGIHISSSEIWSIISQLKRDEGFRVDVVSIGWPKVKF